jgi:hypothetical protein
MCASGIREKMANRHQDNNSILALRRSRRINARRDVDVERGFSRNQVLLEDAVKRLLVLVGKEDVVGIELRNDL